MCRVAPSATASSALAIEREMVVTVAPMAAAILTPMWPRPADADDGDRAAGAGAPPAQRRVRRDAGAEQRRGDVEVHGVGDAQHEALADDDLLRVAAHRPLAVVALRVVGADRGLGAEHLHAVLARLALAARVDEAADADAVADGVAGDLVTDLDARCRRSRGRRSAGSAPAPTPHARCGCRSGRCRRRRWRCGRRRGAGRGARCVPWRKPEVAESAMSAGVVVGIRATLCRSELGQQRRPPPRGRPWPPWSVRAVDRIERPTAGASAKRTVFGIGGHEHGQVVALADVLEHLARVGLRPS